MIDWNQFDLPDVSSEFVWHCTFWASAALVLFAILFNEVLLKTVNDMMDANEDVHTCKQEAMTAAAAIKKMNSNEDVGIRVLELYKIYRHHANVS